MLLVREAITEKFYLLDVAYFYWFRKEKKSRKVKRMGINNEEEI